MYSVLGGQESMLLEVILIISMICEMELQRTETKHHKQSNITNTKCTRVYNYESKPEKSNEWSGLPKDIDCPRVTTKKMVSHKAKEKSCSFKVTRKKPERNCYKEPFATIYDMVCYNFIYSSFLQGYYLPFNSLLLKESFLVACSSD